MSNFTQGPWAVQKAEDCMGRHLDDAVKWVVTSAKHDIWISTGPTWDPEHAEESEANARLIAAAPELLEAAMAFIAPFDGIEVVQDSDIAKARAAIAKATGEPA